MKLLESDFSNQVLKQVKTKIGDIFFFNHIAIIEFYEAVHVDVDNCTEIFNEIKTYFGDARSFGIISNRINSYSIKLLDVPLFRLQFKNLKGYAVVGYTPASKMNAKIENNYCLSHNIDFDNIYEAVDFVYRKVRHEIQLSLY
ncbi:hypothetical protein GCM10022291_23520 [Postechiella marina]|uniref:Uncharacterized protein n=1 Tax=Postechiella marina TaxID=943941 RepID=A0ABP8CC05_9FLAO